MLNSDDNIESGTDQPSGEVVVEACTRFHDTICGCKPGYWREEGKVGNCQKVSPCEPRYGVMKMVVKNYRYGVIAVEMLDLCKTKFSFVETGGPLS
ncbi:hypothetical protein MAR_008472 [Mya arenaria]|uniref:EGF-like domain-containing protein n=1 Tax=Mya arenaria TaxID=6604 RepID=A0ABY7DY18_MYAAR|nr:hypothetical protein MAR_008472 [Mya arenaria]